MIRLTEQQWQAVKKGEGIRVFSPEMGEDIVILRAAGYESIRELLEDQREQQEILRYAMNQARWIAQEEAEH